MAKILIVDRDQFFLDFISGCLKKAGHEVTPLATNLSEGLERLETIQPDIIILNFPPPPGTSYFYRKEKSTPKQSIKDSIKKYIVSSTSRRIIVTGNQLNSADISEIINMGAFDCFEKPFNFVTGFDKEQKLEERVISTVSSAVNALQTAGSLDKKFKRENIIGNSHAILSCLVNLNNAAKTDAPILITGETGTGKELFATAAHENSKRWQKTLVPLDCGALPESIIEGHLFGHKKGAHSTAYEDKDGLFKEADGGTLFLDEIGNLSENVQAKLLRAVEQKTFYPMGATEPERSDFRLVCATNENLKQKVSKGHFRADLYARISAFAIHLPPLRDRKEDIKDIAAHFIHESCDELDLKHKSMTQEFIKALEMHEWLGNIRELKSIIKDAVAMAGDNKSITPDHLTPQIRGLWIAARGYMIGVTDNVIDTSSQNSSVFEKDAQSDPSAEIQSLADITPESIIAGKIEWNQILELSYEHRVSLMVVARSLWKGQQKELAKMLGAEVNAFEQFFSTAKKKARSGKLTLDMLTDFVSDVHRPELQDFFSITLNRDNT